MEVRTEGLHLRTLIVCTLFLTLLTLVTAQPPQQSSLISDFGLQLESPIIESIQANQTFEFHVHVHNMSDGTIFSNTEIDFCSIHLYAPTGGHLVSANMTPSGSQDFDLEYEVLAGNFTQFGQYAVYMYCEVQNADPMIGGFLEYGFEVTPTGELFISEGQAILYSFLLLISIILFAFLFYWMMVIPFGNFFDTDSGAITQVNDWKYVKLFLIPVNYVLLMWIFGLMRSVSANYLLLPGPALVFNWAFWVMLSFAFPLLIVALWFTFLNIINDKKIREGLERGDWFKSDERR